MPSMQLRNGGLVYSATDLNEALECDHLSALERAVALGQRERPDPSPTAELLARKGAEHETRQLQRFRAMFGDRIAEPSGVHETLDAMAAGAPLIYQAAFFDGTFTGRADILRRIETASPRWAWSYEVLDIKLALSPKPNYLLQLANYSEHVERICGSAPEFMYVVLGSGAEKRFRVDDYAAYYRYVKARFLERMAAGSDAYPAEVAYCTTCRWSDQCASRRDRDDHLSLVARIRGDQIRKLEAQGITKLATLAAAADDERPRGMEPSTFANLRAQAALQHGARTTGRLRYELLAPDSGGLALLPPPDDGDVFFDMEGDPLYAPDRGLEYLFGLYLAKEREYVAFWARSPREEREAFMQCIDFLIERRKRYPQMHAYHYASYEASALRRLMGFYGTREAEVDSLLRNETLIDLFTVVRQALRISQSSYSIKKLEPFYGMTRTTDVQRGDDSIVMFESWRIEGNDAILADIERYNADDCRSTARLRDWLLERRAEFEATHAVALPWRGGVEKTAPDDGGRGALADALIGRVEPPDSLTALRERGAEDRLAWLLGSLLGYHAREAKPGYWAFYDRRENLDRLVEFDHEALGGLQLRTDLPVEQVKQSFVYTYEFPDQQHNLGAGDKVQCPVSGGSAEIVELDDERNLVRVRLSKNIVPAQLTALVPGPPLNTTAQRDAIARVAQCALDGSLAQRFPAARSLLLAEAPRLRVPRDRIQPERIDANALIDLARNLDTGHLVVQGPPGTGKSTLGAATIVELLREGRRIGIVANGHKAIHNLLHKVEERAREAGVTFSGVQKFTADSSRFVSRHDSPSILSTNDYAAFDQPHDLAAGTPWLFSRAGLEGTYDYLFIDEAGQMSLADALACATAARNIVLLGDPLQLAQVSQGAHPPGTGLSVLEHLLGGRSTVDPAHGVFLDRSYRLAPPICDFISHGVYEGRLHADRACAHNAVDGESGLRFAPVDHDGNTRASDEEARVAVTLVSRLLRSSVVLGDEPPRPMSARDVLVVAPYNAQRKLLRRRLAEAGFGEIAVGTVDKFQGQEAPVVIYSMATSSGATLPRDMEFLFEKNRLNVAISRAQCLSILVCSPRLLGVRCTTPDQMSLVNLLCSFAERAEAVKIAEYSPLS
jgi:uncharacterized protein